MSMTAVAIAVQLLCRWKRKYFVLRGVNYDSDANDAMVSSVHLFYHNFFIFTKMINYLYVLSLTRVEELSQYFYLDQIFIFIFILFFCTSILTFT